MHVWVYGYVGVRTRERGRKGEENVNGFVDKLAAISRPISWTCLKGSSCYNCTKSTKNRVCWRLSYLSFSLSFFSLLKYDHDRSTLAPTTTLIRQKPTSDRNAVKYFLLFFKRLVCISYSYRRVLYAAMNLRPLSGPIGLVFIRVIYTNENCKHG